MMGYDEQARRFEGGSLQSPFVFGTIFAEDEDMRMVKIKIQPWDTESGWCRVLKDTFYPIPPHATHAHHADPDGEQETEPHPGKWHKHDKHTPHIPQWPYKVGMEVLAAVVTGSYGNGEFVVLGPLDDGELDPAEEPKLTEIPDDEWGV